MERGEARRGRHERQKHDRTHGDTDCPEAEMGREIPDSNSTALAARQWNSVEQRSQEEKISMGGQKQASYLDPLDALIDFSSYDEMSRQPPSISSSSNLASQSSNSQPSHSGSSHNYDMYKQQNGIPQGSLANTLAFNQQMNQYGFSEGYLSGLNPSDAFVDFGSSPVQTRFLSDFDIEFDSPELEPAFFYPESPEFVNPQSTLSAPAVLLTQTSNVGRLWPGMHQQQAALAKAQAQQKQQQQFMQQQRQKAIDEQQRQQSQNPRGTHELRDPTVEEKNADDVALENETTESRVNSKSTVLPSLNLPISKPSPQTQRRIVTHGTFTIEEFGESDYEEWESEDEDTMRPHQYEDAEDQEKNSDDLAAVSQNNADPNVLSSFQSASSENEVDERVAWMEQRRLEKRRKSKMHKRTLGQAIGSDTDEEDSRLAKFRTSLTKNPNEIDFNSVQEGVDNSKLLVKRDSPMGEERVRSTGFHSILNPSAETGNGDFPKPPFNNKDDVESIKSGRSGASSIASIADSIFSFVSNSSMSSIARPQSAIDRLVALLLGDDTFKSLCVNALAVVD